MLRRNTIFVGATVLLLLLAANFLFSFRAARRLLANEALVNHTQAVLLQIETVGSLLTDAETGQRGYLYTGDPTYLRPYLAAIRIVNAQLAELAALTAENPRQKVRMVELRAHVRAKLDELEQTIALQRKGKHRAVRDLVLSDLGQRHMATIRDLLGQMRDEEEHLATARSVVSARSAHELFLTFLAATVVAALGVLMLAVLVAHDRRCREADAAAIRIREQWLDTTLRSIADGVIATDFQGRVVFLNSVAERLTGHSAEQAKGRPLGEVFHTRAERAITPVSDAERQGMRESSMPTTYTVVRRSDGTEFLAETSAARIRDPNGAVLGTAVVFRDISERRHAEEALRRAERLATAGRLSAVIAHEINNPLEAVTNLLFLTSQDASLPAEAKDYICMAEREIASVLEIARQTLTFYRQLPSEALLCITELLDSVVGVFRNRVQAAEVCVVVDYADAPAIPAFPAELRQVFANLLANALDAVGNAGKIGITARRATEDGCDGIRVSIEDDGPGITPDNLNRVFEPFFTTKGEVGTGLGLWVSKGLVEKYGGIITVTSATGAERHGTRFDVFLPAGLRWSDSTAD